MSPKIRFLPLLISISTLGLLFSSCTKEPETEIVAVSQYEIDEQKQAEAQIAQAERLNNTAGTLSPYRYAGVSRLAEEENDNIPGVVLSRGKGGEAPAEAKRFSWYFNDTDVFGDIAPTNVKVAGLPCSLEKIYIKNLADPSLEKQINTWIDDTVNAFTVDKALPMLIESGAISADEGRLYIYQTNSCSNGVLSIAIQMDVYPNITAYAVETFTCDLSAGKRLELGDLFYNNVDYLNYINKRIIDQVSSPGFFEVDFSELKRPFSGISENHPTFTVNGSSLSIYFPFGNEFFGTGATVQIPIGYTNYVYSDPTRVSGFAGSSLVRIHNLIGGNIPKVTAFKSVDTDHNVNISSVRFDTGDKSIDEQLNAIVVSAEASVFSPVVLRDALSDFLSPEEQINYRIDVSYLQSVVLGGRFLFLQYQIFAVGPDTSYSSLRSVCIDTITCAPFTFEDLIPGSIPWKSKTAVISQTYYNPATADPADVICVSLKNDGGIVLTMKVNQSSLISDEKSAKLSIDPSCFDWENYMTY